MSTYAVIKQGGKQYLVRENDEITVDHMGGKTGPVDLETLAIFDEEGKTVEIGSPTLAKKVKAQVVKNLKGEKIRIAKFKAKVRYRKVRGFRPMLTTLKIVKI